MDMQQALTPTQDREWLLVAQGYDPLRESSIEARFAVSNGFLGVRASRTLSRGPTWISWLHTLTWASWPRTYVAGLFDSPNTNPPVPALVPVADWLRLRILLNGRPLLQHTGETLMHQRFLDLRRGVMLTDWRQHGPDGTVIRARTLRLVSLADRALGMQLVSITVEQGTADITIDARFGDAGEGLDAVRLDQDQGVWRTEQSAKSLSIACAAWLQVDDAELSPKALGPFRWRWAWTSAPDQTVSFQRLIAVARGGDTDGETARAARDALDRARSIGWRAVLEQHEAAWAERWRCSDIAVEGDVAAQRAVRFAIYHLNSAANPTDERVSIGARALTGDAYLGHVFWDTEIYVLPFFIATWPEAARSLLMYRRHTLPGARAKATRLGWRGAMYAWESTDTGEETTPEQVIGPDGKPIKVLCGTEEQHITADIAYAVWQYWHATGDDDFMLAAGAEIMLDTARFWASRAAPEADGKRHIRGVIGPDEYHETIDDSAYTNVMARWNIRRGLEMAALLRDRWPARWAELAKRLDLDEAELREWTDAAERLFIGYDPRTGLFEQFTGFFSLEDLDLSRYAGRTMPLDVVLGRERTQRTQVVKQADVVALLALLPEEIDARAKRANFRYYEPRCGHGSSLSRGMHALVAARLNETDMALRYFNETAAIDLEDGAGGSAGGIHIAALGGLWQAAVFGFAGVSLQADALALDPRLPTGWRTFAFHVHWRGRRVRIAIDQDADRIGVDLVKGEPMRVRLRGQPHELQTAETLRLRYRPEG